MPATSPLASPYHCAALPITVVLIHHWLVPTSPLRPYPFDGRCQLEPTEEEAMPRSHAEVNGAVTRSFPSYSSGWVLSFLMACCRSVLIAIVTLDA
ncbi:hypothetical protein E2562_019357 [Oryza meyeriana var. granulata]|uniref:Uncharacterized protein n=1 Tax=Oryza meyeriana var. granulata TaxID=110450 RepID=A0A6G1BLQ7_9ORYZ|nr:hypothetical protein E2562_019357 [Oryza meyeriana var. granulata]